MPRVCRRVAWAAWAAWITEPPAALAPKKGHRLFSNSEEAMADAGIRGEATVVTDGADDQTLARDMIEVHGGRLPLWRGRTLVWRRSRVRPRERNNGSGCSGSSSGSSLAKDRQSGPPLERGPESAAQMACGVHTKAFAGQPLNTAQVR